MYTHIFTIPGLYNYDCSVGAHAQNGMAGTVTVNLGGCTDPNAFNYDSLATVDDGSCCSISFAQIGQDIDGDSHAGLSGYSVSSSSDGSIVAIGAEKAYPAYGYAGENLGGNWTQIGQDIYGKRFMMKVQYPYLQMEILGYRSSFK